MSWTFNPPPGWPPQPEGWVPPPGWAPDPQWPPAPDGWQFWVPVGPTGPAPATGMPQATAGTLHAAGTPQATAGTPPPVGDRPPAAAAVRPWFTRWWAIVGLIALLVIGSAVGFGATRAALELTSDSDSSTTDGAGGPDGGQGGGPAAAARATPVASVAPGPTESPRLAMPTISPPSVAGAAGELCADVALIMITMVTATAEAEDFEAYLDSVVETRRTAADELRSRAEDTDTGSDRTALEEFAGEIDVSAQMVEDDPTDQDTFEDSFDVVSDAYQAFTDDHC